VKNLWPWVENPRLSSELDPIWLDFLKKIMTNCQQELPPFLAKNLEKWSNPNP